MCCLPAKSRLDIGRFFLSDMRQPGARDMSPLRSDRHCRRKMQGLRGGCRELHSGRGAGVATRRSNQKQRPGLPLVRFNGPIPAISPQRGRSLRKPHRSHHRIFWYAPLLGQRCWRNGHCGAISMCRLRLRLSTSKPASAGWLHSPDCDGFGRLPVDPVLGTIETICLERTLNKVTGLTRSSACRRPL